jgi:ATP-binding cassette subfamily B protein RaxB
MQDDQLLSGSIADNVCFFDQGFDHAHMQECARLACVHDDIMRMPMGYQTLVGGMGATLSGGQKQRILLARALYKKPRFLLLDEYTSHLDFATEARVQQSINALGCGRFIITHRQHTLSEGDQILILYNGRLLTPEALQALQAQQHAEAPPPAQVSDHSTPSSPPLNAD